MSIVRWILAGRPIRIWSESARNSRLRITKANPGRSERKLIEKRIIDARSRFAERKEEDS